MNNHELTVTSSSPSRFSLVLLEPGEIYFEDYLVYYHETRNPLNSSAEDTTQSTTSQPIKGNLKICSKSVVFDPINFSYPIVKFSYKLVDLIEFFNEEDTRKEDEDDLYTIRPANFVTEKNNTLKQKCFAISCKQTINCKVNNKIAPYVLKKSESNKINKYYFELIFTNVNDSLDLLMQLHRASTLEYEEEDVMQQLILKSRLKRDFNFDVHQFEDLSKEQVQFEAIVNKINPLVANPGKIILTNMCLYYKPFNNLLEDNQTNNVFKIRLKQIKYVIKRRYHLKRVGCEIIFDNPSSISTSSGSLSSNSAKRLPYLYLTFEDEPTRDQFYMRLTVDQASKLTNLEEFNQENMLQRWRYGAISNFDYLMYLNNMADRSYNDLTQYPVFPWVLNDYSSDELDLTNPRTFRDLSKPIGALNEERLARLRQRYFEMKMQTTQFNSNHLTSKQESQPTFLYGSHYSTPAFVLFYLVRQYPEWQLCLQNGRFDHPNRLFHSIDDTWRNCLTIDSDVKELLPEFYDLGDYNCNHQDRLESRLNASSVGAFLRNDLELELGVRSDGVRVNHVILPPWAHNSTLGFIEKMRDALESPYVSENLHKWIDLIFGYKQKGQEAIDANNLFYYLCYEGAVDLSSITDYSQRKSLEIQIQEFGQIPTQLFKTPHLPKAKQIGEMIDLEYLSSPSKSMSLSNRQLINATTTTSSMINQSCSSPLTFTKSTAVTSNSEQQVSFQSEVQLPYRISASSFTALEVKLSCKMHKSQVNDLIFLDEHIPQSDINKQKTNELNNKANLPLMCSVSNDNWIKIYSLHERSIFRSHNVANFSLSSVDCVQIWKASSDVGISGLGDDNAEIKDPLDEEDSSNHVEDELVGSSFESGDNVSSATGTLSSLETTNSEIKFTQTLLFLSCWDNSIYVYDMNYNRCIYHLADSHDDAISRLALIKIPASRSFLLVTSSWDSSIKIWLTSPISKPRSHKQRSSSLSSSMFDQNFKLQFLNELSHDSAVLDFCLTRTYLASICEDGDVLLWRLNLTDKGKVMNNEEFGKMNSENEEDVEYERAAQFKLWGRFARLSTQPSLETTFNFQYSIEHTNEMGKITDCRIIESSTLATLAICTSLGFVKIFNISTATELFSIRIAVPGLPVSSYAKLNRLFYTNDYILTVDSNGYLYFIDLQQQGGISTSMKPSSASKSSSSSFLSHHIKLTSSSITSIAVYKDFVIACGDSDGYLHFLSLLDI